ncbi:uncharacterized protein [Miscanthus floridulus]|uniref:uncharacterized protein n=1 Tax=Miscanthus floridulus TaxID=154761 RepID=UPI003458C6FC
MTKSSAMSGSIKFMTYNVWSCERVAVYRRIKSTRTSSSCRRSLTIFTPSFKRLHGGELTKSSYQREITIIHHSCTTRILPRSVLWLSKLDAGYVALPKYNNYVVFGGSSPPRFPPAGNIPSDLLSAWVYTKQPRLRAVTCRLPSPCPSSIGYEHRRARASAFLEHFDVVHQPRKYERSFVLGGDLGWDDDLDGPLRQPPAPMLRGLNLPVERKRPDRFICKLRDFMHDSIQMIGVDAIPGVTRFDDKQDNFVAVRPSYHFGLLLTISPK